MSSSSVSRSRRRTVGAVLLAATLGVGGVAWSQRSAPAAPAVATPATTLVAPGIVEAQGDRVELGFEVAGRIAALAVDEGDRVVAGQVLAHLDDRVAQARVARAEAAVAAAKARRDLARRGARPDEIKAAAAEADAATAQARERGQARDRAEALLAANANAIPLAEVDTARGLADASAAQARAAAARAAVLRQGSRKEQIAEATAAVAGAAAELEETRALLAQHELRAPRDGVIIRRLHEVGEHVSIVPPTTVLVLADTSRLELRVEVDEVDVASIAIGQPTWATALAYGDRRFPGTIVRVVGELGRKTQRLDDPRARIDTRVLEVVVTLDSDVALPLGLRMDVHVGASP